MLDGVRLQKPEVDLRARGRMAEDVNADSAGRARRRRSEPAPSSRRDRVGSAPRRRPTASASRSSTSSSPRSSARGIGAFVVLVEPADAPPEEPAGRAGSRRERARTRSGEIADARRRAGYRLPSGKQLVGVASPAPAEVQELPIRAVVDPARCRRRRRSEDDVEVIEVGNSVMYTLCGVGAEVLDPRGRRRRRTRAGCCAARRSSSRSTPSSTWTTSTP